MVAGLCIRHKLNEAANIDMKELHADYTDITVREYEIITKLTAEGIRLHKFLQLILWPSGGNLIKLI